MPRMIRDEDVTQVMDMITNGENPFASTSPSLIYLSSGAVARNDTVHDLFNAYHKGQIAMVQFAKDWLSHEKTVDFHTLLPKLKLKSFTSISAKRSV